MTIENISLFQAMNAKMGYLAERQKIISQNVANADTPGYMSQDLRKVDFSKMVENISKNKKENTKDLNKEGNSANSTTNINDIKLTNYKFNPQIFSNDFYTLYKEINSIQISKTILSLNLFINQIKIESNLVSLQPQPNRLANIPSNLPLYQNSSLQFFPRVFGMNNSSNSR